MAIFEPTMAVRKTDCRDIDDYARWTESFWFSGSVARISRVNRYHGPPPVLRRRGWRSRGASSRSSSATINLDQEGSPKAFLPN